MADLTNGNGRPNGDRLRSIADATTTLLLARAAQLVGIPLGLWLITQAWGDLRDMRLELQSSARGAAVIEQRVTTVERRVDRHDAQIDRLIDRRTEAPPGSIAR